MVKAVIPHTVHIVTDNNKKIYYNLITTSDYFDLIPGSYTFSELGDHFIDQLNAKTGKTFTIKSDTNTYKYELGWSFGEDFYSYGKQVVIMVVQHIVCLVLKMRMIQLI